MERRVVVTGLGVISSIGLDVETYWSSLLAGKSGVRPIAGFDTTGFTCKIAGEIPQFDPRRWLDKRTTDRMDRFSQMGLVAAMQAVQDSGLDFQREDRTRCGVIIGTGIGGLIEIEEQHKRLLERGPTRVSPFLVPKLMGNACAGQVSIHYGLQGPNLCATTACASSSHSIGIAFATLRSGGADVILTGGSEAAITPLGMAGFCSAKALSTRNDEPEKASRPFDKDRDGFVMGEGAGVVVLEELEHARKRGARIYAEFLGFGMSGDGTHIVEPDPSGRGPARAMTAALQDGRTNPSEITYINAHGTSTPLGDKAETASVKIAFGDSARKVAISSTKSMIGHLLGASGGVELVATVLSLHRDIIHPTINYTTPDPDCDLDYVPNQPRQVPVFKAISNSFGFGGHNGTLLLGKFNG
ncbi:MAG: beta-ketoacyl-ACP synthase II [Candidatus Brocadiia bacterium]